MAKMAAAAAAVVCFGPGKGSKKKGETHIKGWGKRLPAEAGGEERYRGKKEEGFWIKV